MPAATDPRRADDSPAPCALCGIDRAGAGLVLAGSPVVVAYATDDLVAVAARDGSWMLIASRSHSGRLAAEPREAGILLGALRRAATEVAASAGASRYRVDPVSDVPEAPGHVCYRVQPEPGGPAGATAIDVERLTAALARSGPKVRPAVGPRQSPFPG